MIRKILSGFTKGDMIMTKVHLGTIVGTPTLSGSAPVNHKPFDGTVHFGCVSKVGGNVRCLKPLYELGESGYVGASGFSTFVSTHPPDMVAHYIKCENALSLMAPDEMPQTLSAMRAFVNRITA